MPKRSCVALAAFLALVTVGARAAANEQSDIEKGRVAYLAHQFDEADARFRAMLDPKTGTVHDPALVTQARMYWGAVKLARGKQDEAIAIFEQLLLADPGFDPDPLSFPTEVIDLFIDTRAKIRDKINAAAQVAAQEEAARKAREEEERKRERERVAHLEALASEERTTEHHERFIAFIPFGAGQFQNGQRGLGWFFLISESALALSAAATVPLYLVDLQNRSDAARAGDTYSAQQYINRANTVRAVNLSLNGGFFLVAALGILQANVSYVPASVMVRKRDTAKPSVEPTLAPSASGIMLGIAGRF